MASTDFPPMRPPQRTLFNDIEEEIENPDEIVTAAPAEQFRLGYLDVTCLILNRIIGEHFLLSKIEQKYIHLSFYTPLKYTHYISRMSQFIPLTLLKAPESSTAQIVWSLVQTTPALRFSSGSPASYTASRALMSTSSTGSTCPATSSMASSKPSLAAVVTSIMYVFYSIIFLPLIFH